MDVREPEDRRKPGRSRLRRRVALGVVLLLAALCCWTFRGPIGFANFGVVEPGRVYRCAQPGEDLEQTARERGIRSILNLRGGSEDDEFYRTEVQVADRLNLDFYDLPLSATRRPSRGELLRLLDVLDRCRYPLLIHCKSGADRTGLATALYRLQKLGEAPETAMGGFTLVYGHLPLFGPERLHEPVEEYAEWLSRNHREHSPSRFRNWVMWDYRDSEKPGELARPMRPGPRASLAKERAREPVRR